MAGSPLLRMSMLEREGGKMKKAVLLDFGSTFTKAAVADLERRKIIYTTKAPSTVSIDAEIGLSACFDRIKAVIGEKELEEAAKLATSSAAGGLRMAVSGLTSGLSCIAGKNAACGAGGKIVMNLCGKISESDIAKLEQSDIEILLLCGGYEGGCVGAVLDNVSKIAGSNCRFPVIFAGNGKLQKAVRLIFQQSGKECFCVDNIIPEPGIVYAEPTEEVIRRLFLDRITNMKGLEGVKRRIDRIVMPTPAAVLSAGELLSLGTEEIKGLGPLMIIDVGGATTDIHSYGFSMAAEGAKAVGAKEPYAKRTVEGDLGMRESSGLVMEQIGYDRAAAELNITPDRLKESIGKRMTDTDFLPDGDETEQAIDDYIAKTAVYIAVRRHAGRVEASPSGFMPGAQRGKNLEMVNTIIGTGGPLIENARPDKILKEALKDARDEKLNTLLPKAARFMIDEDYVFYAAGLLREIDEDVAASVMLDSLRDAAGKKREGL